MCGLNPRSVYHWPSCKNHYALTFQKSTWYDWIWDVAYDPHGPVHVWIGGMGGDCEMMNTSAWLSADEEENLKVITLHLSES